MERSHFDGLTFAAIIFLCFIGFNILRDRGLFDSFSRDSAEVSAAIESLAAADTAAETVLYGGLAPAFPAAQQSVEVAEADPNVIAYPYTDFVLTQGVHGEDYGQMAIDIAAGKGVPVLAPINGDVTALYVDEYGNPVLVLENSRYAVMLYHAQFSAKVGERLTIGQPLGMESNQGYTVDAYGQICTGRECGYHTHINVYDKSLGANVNPLEVLQPAAR